MIWWFNDVVVKRSIFPFCHETAVPLLHLCLQNAVNATSNARSISAIITCSILANSPNPSTGLPHIQTYKIGKHSSGITTRIQQFCILLRTDFEFIAADWLHSWQLATLSANRKFNSKRSKFAISSAKSWSENRFCGTSLMWLCMWFGARLRQFNAVVCCSFCCTLSFQWAFGFLPIVLMYYIYAYIYPA